MRRHLFPSTSPGVTSRDGTGGTSTRISRAGSAASKINEVGHAISGWWQTRGWRDQAAKQITTIQHAFVAELHDTSDEFVPVLRYSLDGGATWHGLMTFDLDDTDDSAASVASRCSTEP